MLHHMRLHPRPFREIAEGRKTYEFRLNDEKRQAIRVGDEIEFEGRENPNERITVVVEDLERYPTFDALFDGIPENARAGRDHAAWAAAFREYYSENEEQKEGVLAIRFKKK